MNAKPPTGPYNSVTMFPLFALAYFATAELGHALSFPGNYASFWPPSGVYVAVLLVADVRRWPGFLLAALFANQISDVLLHGKVFPVSVGFWLANTAEAVAGAWMLRRFVGTPFAFNRMKSVFGLFTLSALVSTMLGAAVGAAVVRLAYGQGFGGAWLGWWISDVIGVVAFSPLELTLLTLRPAYIQKVHPLRIVEGLLLLGGIAFNAEFVFGWQSTPLVWTILPLILWAALRFEVAGVSRAIVVLTLFVAYNTAEARGPFAAGWSIVEQMLLARSFITVIAVSFLTVGVLLQERREATRKIFKDKEELRDLYKNKEEHVFSTGPDGRFLRVNRACREALDYTEEEFLSLTVPQVVHPDELPSCLKALERQRAGEKLHIESRVVTKSGETLIVEGTTEFVFEDGQPVGSRSIFRDVTNRKRQE